MARRKRSIDDQIKEGLTALAFGDVSDAVSLLFMTDEQIIASLAKLKLINVSEIKRPKGGGMEIKFFDRIKACEGLARYRSGSNDSGLSFFAALEKGAQNMAQSDSDD